MYQERWSTGEVMDGTVVAPPELEPLYRQLDVSLTSMSILTWNLMLILMCACTACWSGQIAPLV